MRRTLEVSDYEQCRFGIIEFLVGEIEPSFLGLIDVAVKVAAQPSMMRS